MDETTVHRWIKRGQVSSVKVGGTRLVFLPADVADAERQARGAS